MNENQNNVQYKEDEIDLRELFAILWKRKIMIIGIALIGAILAGSFSMFILSPVYNTELKIDLNMPDTFNTRYGEYKLPVSSNAQYMNLIISNDIIANTIKDMDYSAKSVTLESLKKRISIDKGVSTAAATQNIFDITVSADNPKESLKLAKTLYASYIEYVNVMANERAISYYYSNFTAGIELSENVLTSTKEIIKKTEELLAKTPQTIDQSALINNNDNVVIENIINPAYSRIQEDMVASKELLYSTEDTIRANKEYLKELDTERKAIAKYDETGKADLLESSLINVAETSIFLASSPVAPTQKTSPSNARNAAIGLVLGVMLGVGIVLIKEYWFKKA